MLASTYTTLNAQDQRVPEPVVKVAEPQPVQPLENPGNEDNMGAGDDPSQQSKEKDNMKKDGTVHVFTLIASPLMLLLKWDLMVYSYLYM